MFHVIINKSTLCINRERVIVVLLMRLKYGIASLVEKMQRRGTGYEIDMCNGPLLGKIIKFAIPLALSGVLQLLFHATDIIVVGQYAGSTALAAVGATTTLINLFITIFMGMSVGTNVMTARYYASGNAQGLFKIVHTSIAIGVLFGVVLFFVGLFFSTSVLGLTNTPDDVIDQASLYMRIIFAGMPAQLVYNFGSAILRATGDTRRPLYFLSFAGILNVIINLFLVIIVDLGVAGVAIATIFAQYVSATLVLICLFRSEMAYKIFLKHIKIDAKSLIEILKIGLPAGIQGILFTFSNVLIQASINSFGSTVMAGSTAAGNLEGFVFLSLNALHHTAVTFVAQNIGGKKYDRIPKIATLCISIAAVIGLIFGAGLYLLSEPLLSIYNSDPEVIMIGKNRMLIICLPYFICGIMDVLIGVLRGMGYSILTLFTSVIGVGGVRIIWIFTIFESTQSLDILFLSYPVTWSVTAIAVFIQYLVAKKHLMQKADISHL